MKIETIIGVTSRMEAFDRALKEKVNEVNEANKIVDIKVVVSDRTMYGIIGFERRVNRPKAKKVSNTGKGKEV